MSRPDTGSTSGRIAPASNPIMKKVLVYGSLVAAVIAVVGAILGGIIVGATGVASALVGTAMALIYLGVTAASILVANRFASSDVFAGAFFGIVLGSWLLKFVLFIILIVVLKPQPWLNPVVLFICIVASVIGSLAVDVIVVARNRMPYASDAVLPDRSPGGDGDSRPTEDSGDKMRGSDR